MHESVKAKEIERMILKKAESCGVEKISGVVISIGRGEGESREDIEHIVKEHMGLEELKIVEEDISLECASCGCRVNHDTRSLVCPDCSSAKLEISSGMGFRVLEVK